MHLSHLLLALRCNMTNRAHAAGSLNTETRAIILQTLVANGEQLIVQLQSARGSAAGGGTDATAVI